MIMGESRRRAIVFMLFGQSNAVGHAVPMKEEDKIKAPLKNVFGLSRELNQSYDNPELHWSGYLSAGMNLAETQDDTYSVANCLAKRWQAAVDAGKGLPDLYIVHIAIGAQGVTEKFMWYPERPKKLVPGPLGTVDISMYPLAIHVLSLIKESLAKLGAEPEFLLHWRGGEEDDGVPVEQLKKVSRGIYDRMFEGFYRAVGERFPIVMHKFPYIERCLETDPTGESLKSMNYTNSVFEALAADNDNITLFDPRKAPHYVPDTRQHGIFIEDAVHYTPETNDWVAGEILKGFLKG